MKRYPVLADGTLEGPGAEFIKGVGIGDGMKTDLAGNVYSTSGGGPGIVREVHLQTAGIAPGAG
jgi:hypothetical protein